MSRFRSSLTNKGLVTWLQAKFTEKGRAQLKGKCLKKFKDLNVDGSLFMTLDNGILSSTEIPPADILFIISLKVLIVQCYEVNAKCVGARSVKGIRAAMYRTAMNHQARYAINRSRSIWYDNQDLKITLLFEQKSAAENFQGYLECWHVSNPLIFKAGEVVVEEELGLFTAEADELSAVHLNHYHADDTDSPLGSLDDFRGSIASVETVMSLSDPIFKFQKIEAESKFEGMQPYRCHIKPVAEDNSLRKDENDIIAATWQFHQFLDGMNTIDPLTETARLPLLQLKPLTDGIIEEYVGEPAEKRQRVEMEVEFRTETIANNITLKDSSTKLSNKKWRTFVHVRDAKTFCDNLTWKYKDTNKKWIELDKFDRDMLERD